MKTKITFALFCLLLLSCKKDVNFHVKIINPATGEGYANHEFYIKSSKTGSDGQIVKTEYTGVTDQNGEAIVPLKIKKSVAYYVTPAVVPNTCYINSIDLYYNNTSDPNPQFTFEIALCGNLQINVKNINCQGPSDKIVFHFKPEYLDGTGNMLPLERFGCYENEFIQETVPMGNWIATWTVTKNGITTNHDSLFYIPVNQLFYFNLFY
jgi:hypothetical protein